MEYLILNILFSSCFILCVKWVQGRPSMDTVTVGAVNYLAAAICALPGFLNSTPSEQVVHACWTGAAMGGCYFSAFFFLLYAVHWVGASQSAAVSRVSLVVPIAAGIWLWGERPDGFQVAGILIAFISLFLIGRTNVVTPPENDDNNDRPAESPVPATTSGWSAFFVLGAFFLICGASRLTQQACSHLSGGPVDSPAFLQFAFLAAGIASAVVLAWRKKKITGSETLVGMALGATNILQSHYILCSLNLFDGFLVFTVTSTGGLILTTIIAVFYFRERLSWQSWLAIGLSTVAIVFLQVPFAELSFGGS